VKAAVLRKFATFLVLVVGVLAGGQSAYSAATPDESNLDEIRQRFRISNLTNAKVRLDSYGRVELIGRYRDRADVQTAFSIAQSVVGVRWVAPTTPENIEYIAGKQEADCKFLRAVGKPCSGEAPTRPQSTGPERAVHAKHALVVGVGEFANLPRTSWLRYTVRDAEAFARYLTAKDGGNFPRSNVTLLTDAAATRANIESAMDRIAARVRPGDTVVVYFSSHGSPLNDRANMNIITYDTQAKPRERVFLTSLSDDRLADFIERMREAHVLVILDTCYSGKAYEKVPGFLASGAKDLFLDEDRELVQGVSSKALSYIGTGGKHPSGGSPGAVVPSTLPNRILISASDASQRSWESDSLRNSYFTYYLIEGFQDQRSALSAYQYAKPIVMREVQREKQEQQTPQAVFMPDGADLVL
jgi:hypothetical protein